MQSKIKYRCPHCGKKAVLGEHFCDDKRAVKKTEYDPDQDLREGAEEPEYVEVKKYGPHLRYALAAVIAAFLIILVLWQSAGLYSLLILIAIPFILFVTVVARRAGKSAAAYKRLLLISGNDKQRVERLIASAQEKHPELSRTACIERVLSKLVYDRER